MDRDSIDGLTAEDVMATNVISIGPSDSIREALRLMLDNQITGLPVVDRHSTCVGTVTSRDILAVVRQDSESSAPRFFDPDSHEWEFLGVSEGMIDELPESRVANVMSPQAIAVLTKTRIRDVARVMRDQHIHRVFVLDSDKNLRGVISSFDFVRIFADSTGERAMGVD